MLFVFSEDHALSGGGYSDVKFDSYCYYIHISGKPLKFFYYSHKTEKNIMYLYDGGELLGTICDSALKMENNKEFTTEDLLNCLLNLKKYMGKGDFIVLSYFKFGEIKVANLNSDSLSVRFKEVINLHRGGIEKIEQYLKRYPLNKTFKSFSGIIEIIRSEEGGDHGQFPSVSALDFFLFSERYYVETSSKCPFKKMPLVGYVSDQVIESLGYINPKLLLDSLGSKGQSK
jgi:hypothetical protein